jgi:hypothetical protein
MNTIKQQLKRITECAYTICEITENWKMGFITINEMSAQIMEAQLKMDSIRTEIKNEYDINDNAISLMFLIS